MLDRAMMASEATTQSRRDLDRASGEKGEARSGHSAVWGRDVT